MCLRPVALVFFVVHAAAVPAAAECGDPSDGPRLGLALSGGGARGLAHVGVLRAFDEAGIPVDCIAGTSMGAIVGALTASGLSVADVEATLLAVAWRDLLGGRQARPTSLSRRLEPRTPLLGVGFESGRIRLGPGALADYPVNRFLIRSLALPGWRAAGDFDRLSVPFRAVAFDLRSGDRVVLGEGDLALAVRASMSVPVALAPVAVGTRLLVDGGVADNLPADVPRDMGADLVVAVDVTSPPTAEYEDSLGVANRVTDLLVIARNARQDGETPTITIRPDLEGFGFPDFEQARSIIERGYEAGRRAIPTVRARIGERRASPPAGGASEPARVGEVRLFGLDRARPGLVRHALGLAAGQPFELARAVSGLDAIEGLGLFEWCWMRLVPGGDGDVDIWIRVHEAPRLAGEVGGSYDESRRASGFVRLRALDLAGAGEEATLTGGASESETRLQLDLHTDRLGGAPLGAALRLRWLEDRPRVFDEQGSAGRAAFVNSDVRAALRLRLPGAGVFETGLTLGRVRTVERAGLELPAGTDPVRAWEGLLLWDRLDDPSAPSRGMRVGLAGRRRLSALGDVSSTTTLSTAVLGVWPLGADHRLEARALVELPWGDVPRYDQARLGGPVLLPGYPRDGLWGAAAAGMSGDYSVGTAGRLRLHVRAGVGGAWMSRRDMSLRHLRYGFGGGLEHPTPIGPARLDWGVNDQGHTELHVSLGHP